MGYLNYEFFDEFKALDNLCRDIYGESIDTFICQRTYRDHVQHTTKHGTSPANFQNYIDLKKHRDIMMSSK